MIDTAANLAAAALFLVVGGCIAAAQWANHTDRRNLENQKTARRPFEAAPIGFNQQERRTN
jgi:hypothetical protein